MDPKWWLIKRFVDLLYEQFVSIAPKMNLMLHTPKNELALWPGLSRRFVSLHVDLRQRWAIVRQRQVVSLRSCLWGTRGLGMHVITPKLWKLDLARACKFEPIRMLFSNQNAFRSYAALNLVSELYDLTWKRLCWFQWTKAEWRVWHNNRSAHPRRKIPLGTSRGSAQCWDEWTVAESSTSKRFSHFSHVNVYLKIQISQRMH